MLWTIERTDTFLKHIKQQKNNHELLRQLDDKIKILQQDPFVLGGELSGVLHGKRSTRLAKNFRLIFQIDTQKKVVYLVALDHRGKVYE